MSYIRSNKLLLVLACFGLITSLLISLYHLAFHNKIYPHVFVAGHEVSNLNLTQAQQAIAASLPQTLPDLSLVFGSQSWPLPLYDLTISYQVETTAQNAYLFGRSNGLFNDLRGKWRRWRQPEMLPVKFTYNEAKLQTKLAAIIQTVSEPVISPALEQPADGTIKLIPGKNGRVVDTDQLYQQLLTQIGYLDFSPLSLPVKLVTTQVSELELSGALERAETIKNKGLSLKSDDQVITVKKQELLNLVGFATDWNETEIASLAARLASQIDRPAQDAVFQFDGQTVTEFKPALPGLSLNQTASRTAIAAALENLVKDEALEQVVTLTIATSAPKTTTESVNDLGIKELLGKGESTFFGSIPGRKHNLALAAGRLNGRLIAPGETFSFNQAVGDISAATGYQSAYIIKGGRTILGDGGGVCQVSTTLFRAVLNAGLAITERHPHSYRVSYYEQNAPAGFDATVYAPGVDFKFTNDSPNHVLIQTTTDLAKNYLKFELYGTSDGRHAATSNPRLWGQIPPPEPQYQDDPTLPVGTLKQVDWAAWGGKAAFDWQVERNGEILYKKTFYSNFQPWQAVWLRGTM
ncbi:MAG: VanW family protein [Patescibacteria group bacterium]|nr:VanW family protein [Patescibacteria group bacterium]